MISKQMVAWGESGCSIREIAAYGERRAAEIGPENVYNFAIGNPSIDPPDCVQERRRRPGSGPWPGTRSKQETFSFKQISFILVPRQARAIP